MSPPFPFFFSIDLAVVVAGCKFASDQAGQFGGGLMVKGDGTAAVIATKVTGCSAVNAGGVIANSSAADGFVMTGCTLAGNTATGGSGVGGGLSVVRTRDFHVSGSSVTGNAAANGGGVFLQNSGGSILGTAVTGNAATGSGGGVFMQVAGPVTLQVATMHGNTAPTDPDLDGTFTFV